MEAAVFEATDAVIAMHFKPKKERMMAGRRPKVTPAPNKFDRQRLLKEKMETLTADLEAAGLGDLLGELTPIKTIAKEVDDRKTGAKISHVEEPLSVYIRRTTLTGNKSQRAPFDHLNDAIYRRLMRDFVQGAQMPEARVAAVREMKRVLSLTELDITYSIIDGLQRSWCYATLVLLALHRDSLVADGAITPEAWNYFKPVIDTLGDRDTSVRNLLQRTIRYEIYWNIALEGLLHYMVTFNTAQRRMSLPVQLEIMRGPLIDEIERQTSIPVFRDSVDIEAQGRTQKAKEQFAASDLAVAAEAFITNNPQASQKELAEDFLEKDGAYASGVDIGDIADVVMMLTRVAKNIHPAMLDVYKADGGKKFYFSSGGTFMAGFAAACGFIRNRGDNVKLTKAMDKLVALLAEPVDDPLSLGEYQDAIKDIHSSRGKMMRRLVYDTFLRFFNGTTDRLEWTDAVRSLSLT
jgi:hypothetical protein